jgi:hypothetical protein
MATEYVDSAQIIDRPTRRAAHRPRPVSDEIIAAFHHACDLKDYEVAKRLLDTVEGMLASHPEGPSPAKRRLLESLVAGHERLWSIKNS